VVPPRAPSFSVAHRTAGTWPLGRRSRPSAAVSARTEVLEWRSIMRARELRGLTDEELEQKMADTRQELFNLRFQSATGALENSARLRMAKREIARILTVKHERELG
jgi:large subunit ribosomal protein L29